MDLGFFWHLLMMLLICRTGAGKSSIMTGMLWSFFEEILGGC